MHLIARVLSGGRLLILVPVIGSFVAAIAMSVLGLIYAAGNVMELLAELQRPTGLEGSELAAKMIATMDAFLIGVVLYIFSVALYELFIGPLANMPRWLIIRNLYDLKVKLVSATSMVFAVTAVTHLVLHTRM